VAENKTILTAYKAYKKRLGKVPKKSIMSFAQFKKNYYKTVAKRPAKGRTGVIGRGLKQAGVSYAEMLKLQGK